MKTIAGKTTGAIVAIHQVPVPAAGPPGAGCSSPPRPPAGAERREGVSREGSGAASPDRPTAGERKHDKHSFCLIGEKENP